MTKHKRTPTILDGHEAHRNPFGPKNLAEVMLWANIHHTICDECRNRKPRKMKIPYPATWAADYNRSEQGGEVATK